MYRKGHCTHRSDVYFILLYIIMFLLPCSIMGLVYGRIYCITSSHSKKIRHQTNLGRIGSINHETNNNEEGSDSVKNGQIRQTKFLHNLGGAIVNTARCIEWKVTKVLILVYGSFVLCWLPLILIFFLGKFSKLSLPLYAQVLLAELLPILHSACNPIIYSVFHKDFKKAMKTVILGRLCTRLFTNSSPRYGQVSSRRLHKVEKVVIIENSEEAEKNSTML